jgi:glycosyltransferase involved in cell wall biosynthesis
MTTVPPFVSILIPCYNEEKYIAGFLDSLLQQDYPSERTEIMVIDGNSSDRTRDIIRGFAERHPQILLVDNPGRFVPYALNEGIRKSRGEVIVRMDAHAVYPRDYVSGLVRYLFELNADNVGGSWNTLPGGPGLKALAIAKAVTSPFGIGNAEYRLESDAVRKVDTVPFGCYRRDVFSRIGLFDEELFRNQDIEFNGRLLKNGGTIYLIPGIRITYFARDSVRKLLKMFVQYSKFRPLVNKKLGIILQPRQFVPPAWLLFLLFTVPGSFIWPVFTPILLSGLGLYLAGDLYFSIKSAAGSGRWGLLAYLPWLFFLIHLCYGFGYLSGLARFTLLGLKPRQVASTR